MLLLCEVNLTKTSLSSVSSELTGRFNSASLKHNICQVIALLISLHSSSLTTSKHVCLLEARMYNSSQGEKHILY